MMVLDKDTVALARAKCPPLRGYDAREVSRQTASDSSRCRCVVQQQFKDEVDINTIVRRFGITGTGPVASAEGVYGDFTGIEDLQGALDQAARARAGFYRLPPEVRERYGNDPLELVELAHELSEEDFRAELFGEPEASPGAAAAAPAPGAAPAAPVVPAKPAS